MESVESDLLAKLENIFGFQYGKGKKYQDLGTKDFLDVYKIFFRIYDSAWLLNDEKPTGTVIKQIQSFLKRMELGHLVLKGEDLLDSKKNCRLLGAIVAKLESRHNGTQNILAAVRKFRLLKPKSTDKNFRKQNSASDGSAGEEEPVTPELFVPQKGKELPRTPPGKLTSCPVAIIEPDFLKPKLVTSPPAVPIKTYSKASSLVATKNGFRPILPTKEIPRTPMRGGPSDTFLHSNLNVTADFSAFRLTSSNTSTPYSSASSGSSKKSFTDDATFVVSSKKSAGEMENGGGVSTEAKEIDDRTFDDSPFLKGVVASGTFLKEPKPAAEANTDRHSMDSSWKLEMEDNNGNVEEVKVPSPDAIRTKKKPVKESKSNPIKDSKSAKSEVPSHKMKDDGEEDVKKTASESVPEDVQLKPSHGTAEVAVPASKNKKGKGKKTGKKEAANDVSPSRDPPTATEEQPAEPIVEMETKKTLKGKKIAKKEAVEEPVTAIVNPPVETEAELVAELKGKKSRIKKTNSAAKLADVAPTEADNDLMEKAAGVVDGDVVEPESASKKAGRGGGKKTKKEAAKDVPADKVAEQKEEEAISEVAVETQPIPTAETKKKGRAGGKKNNQQQSVADVPTELPDNCEPVSDVKEKKSRKGTKPSADEVQAVAAVETVEPSQSVAPVVEVKESKRGRGRAKAPAEEPIQVTDNNPTVAEPKEKKGRAKQTKDAAVGDQIKSSQEEDEEIPQIAPPATEIKKGRGRPAKTASEAAAAAADDNENPEVAETAPVKKGRGKKAKVQEEHLEDAEPPRKSSRNKGEPVKSYDESLDSPKKRGRGKKADADVEEAKVEDKKKSGKSKKTVPTETENEPPKAAVNGKRSNKQMSADETDQKEEANVNGTDETSPAKKIKKDVVAIHGAEEPEKKSRGRKKKEEQQPVVAVADVAVEEVEQKKPAGRKKAAGIAVANGQVEPTPSEPVQSKQRGKRGAAVQQSLESTDPPPAGPPPSKGRRLKLAAEDETAAASVTDDAAPAVKRSNRNRK